MSIKKEKIFHLSHRNIGRGGIKKGKVIKSYNIPSRFSYAVGIQIIDEKTGRKYHKKTKAEKEGIETEMILNPGASQKFKDPNFFLNKMNKTETRDDARVFNEMDIALFQDLSIEENKEVARQFCEDFSKKFNTPVSLSFHKMDSHNPHCHVIYSERHAIGEELSAKKIDAMRDRGYLNVPRKMWAERANQYFQSIGKDFFIDHRSYKNRGSQKTPLQRVNVHSQIQDTEEIKKQNKITKVENKEIDYRERKKEFRNERQDQAFISKPKRREALVRAAESKHREEVKTVAEQARTLTQKPKEPIFTVHKLYDQEIKKKEDRFVEVKRLHQEQRNLNKTVNKDRFKERKSLFKEQQLKSKNAIGLKKGDIMDLRLGNKDLKADLKGYSVFNPFNWKQRREIKKQITKNKVKIKKKKFEIKKEKTKQRLQKEKYKEHRKEYVQGKKKEYGLLKEKITNKMKAKVLNREKQQVKNKVIENTKGKVINLADYKKTNKIEKIASQDRKQGRAR